MNKPNYSTDLYEDDEVAWLDATAEQIKSKRYNEIDFVNLQEFLEAMARSERREVERRLARLIEHILKWEYQPKWRGNSWRRTIVEQQQSLRRMLRSGTLRRHAEQVLVECYRDGVDLATAATGLPEATFPVACPWDLDGVLTYRTIAHPDSEDD
jgi:Domain of unknown function DUF29